MLIICQYLHSNIKYISFYNFNLPVGNLPDNLENVQFGSNFNQNVDNLPNKIIRIQFGSKFSQQVDLLPESIKHIEF